MQAKVVLHIFVVLSQAAYLHTLDADFIQREKKVLSFFENVEQMDPAAEWYKIGKEYDLEKNIDLYTDKNTVKEFLALNKTGFLPKSEVFSIFNDRMKKETVAIFNVLFHSIDFDTFYKTAAFIRVRLNEYQFIYCFYIAINHRPDTQDIIVPAAYEIYPGLFTNSGTMFKVYRTTMQDGIFDEKLAAQYGIVKEGNTYYFYANYSTFWTYGNEEKLAYFIEDVGLNSYYYAFHSFFPFWMDSQSFIFKERYGEIWYHFYKRLLARYYLERLCNGLGEVRDFSWEQPIRQGYTPFMFTLYYPFIQRNNNYRISEKAFKDEIKFVETYEKTFLRYLQRGSFEAGDQDISFNSSNAMNFIANYWQNNSDLYQPGTGNYVRSYESIARHLLSTVPNTLEKYAVVPSALTFHQTSLRDPIFYQMYSKILKFVLQYTKHLTPYDQDTLNYPGVTIKAVTVDKMVTYFDSFDYDITNAVYRNFSDTNGTRYQVRQPRVNYKAFNISIIIEEGSAEEREAAFRIFLGPNFNESNNQITLEDNWMNFVELDWFRHKLTPGENRVVRNSKHFFFYAEDALPMKEIYKLQQGIPNGTDHFMAMPRRVMLPKGTVNGFPYKLFVFVYSYQPYEKQSRLFVDNKPLGYPFDRPAREAYFKQPNMFFKDVLVYFEDEHIPK